MSVDEKDQRIARLSEQLNQLEAFVEESAKEQYDYLNALENKEEQVASLARMVNESPQPILRVSKDMQVHYLNEASLSFCESFDIELDQELPALFAKTARKAIKTNVTIEFETEAHGRIYSVVFSPNKGFEDVTIYAQNISKWRAAERASAAKTRFLANMSHEIRTPLNSVIGLSEVLQRQDLNERSASFVKRIFSSSSHLLSLINDVLDVSKIEAGELSLEQTDFDLGECLESIRDLFAHQADKKENLEFCLDVSAGDSNWVVGDYNRLKQVLINLVGNAFKFTGSGKVILRCEALSETDSSNSYRISVVDTGIGIPEQKIHHIFQPFRQVDDSTTREYGGTGLGLAISASLVEKMGGKLHCKSIHNVGSEFFFEIEFPKGERRESVIPVKAQAAEESVRSHKVLVVEDNEANQEVMAAILEELGHEFMIAANGQEGVDLAREFSPTLIFMDCQMPVMDGFAATEKLKQDPELASIPVLALTANALGGERERCLSLGMCDYLTKPIGIKTIDNAIAQWTGHVFNEKPAVALPEEEPENMSFDSSRLLTLNGLKTRQGECLVQFSIHEFIRSTPGFLEDLEVAIDKGDQDLWAKVAHKYKTSCGIVGAIEMERLCQALEATKEKSEALRLFEQLVAAKERTYMNLQSLKSKEQAA